MRLRLLLRPGWLLLAFVVVVFAAACFTLLAPWQFERNAEREATNAALESSTGADPAPLDDVLPAGAAPGPATEWRRVTLRGQYLTDAEAVARLRTVQGNAAFEVLTPFRLPDGSAVLVDRGYVRPVGGIRVPGFAPAPEGTVDLVARVRVDERDPQGRPAFEDATTDGHRQVYAVDSRAVADAAGLALRPGYLQLEDGSPGVLSALPLPLMEAGPFFSYALQWIAFGVMALLGLFYFTWREVKPGGALAEPRPRRLSVAEQLAEDEYSRA
ncbi:SURF1 family cytochrome oxidase biogenesis protein [Actinokineospora spheciospongiae]|uniref:SURF1 family cytochrome oxidase biogenesis protein n=1 Tax=Actinokineospora spheciospongiae TaxID=909613 RepID=UPI000D71006F|nr:SURF1 family cytochrome oxidase biogenesis protein [Actinokineospora spheciospongiae]PWW65286.1 cytochrome oxidase assembly protein ShyY1 [Actinokineospora spheciospongiae]